MMDNQSFPVYCGFLTGLVGFAWWVFSYPRFPDDLLPDDVSSKPSGMDLWSDDALAE